MESSSIRSHCFVSSSDSVKKVDIILNCSRNYLLLLMKNSSSGQLEPICKDLNIIVFTVSSCRVRMDKMSPVAHDYPMCDIRRNIRCG